MRLGAGGNLQRPPDAGSDVSGHESETEFTQMRGWAENICADTLGLPEDYRFTNRV